MALRKKLLDRSFEPSASLVGGGVMTLHQLRIFERVGTVLNITKASESLHISQPSVSQQLKLLEEEFGTKFFVRMSQGVELTPEGKEFFSAVRPILAQAEVVVKTFTRTARANKTVLLKVGGSHNVSVGVLPQLLMALKQSHPLVQFILETNDSPVIEKRLLNSELEIALITNPSYCPEIVYEPHEEIELVAFCLPTHPLVGKKLTLKELVECPLVLRSGGRTERVFMNLGYKMNIALRCEVSSAVKAAVQMGMGVGILYRNAVAGRVARGNLKLLNVPKLKQMKIQSFIIYDRRKPLASMAQEFLRLLREKEGLRLPSARREPEFATMGSLSLR
jgi:LysR family transcriptional regulator, transcriptional activator of the cysJI operon